MEIADYGARSDGVADDSSAVQAAIDEVASSGGGSVRVPEGVTRVGGLRLRDGVALVGAGVGSSILQQVDPAATLPVIQAESIREASVASLTVDGAGAPAELVVAENVAKLVLSHADFRNADQAGVQVVGDGKGALVVESCEFQQLGTVGRPNRDAYDGLYVNGIERLSVRSSSAAECERDGFAAFGVEDVSMEGVSASDCGRFGIVGDVAREHARGGRTLELSRARVTACGAGGVSIETMKGRAIDVTLRDIAVNRCGNDQWGYGGGIVLGTGVTGSLVGGSVVDQAMEGPVTETSQALTILQPSGFVRVDGLTVSGVRGVGVYIRNALLPSTIGPARLDACSKPVVIENSPLVRFVDVTADGAPVSR